MLAESFLSMTQLCENSKNVEKWLAAVELLCLGERAMDEKPRK
jgi:hypothetical protein